MSTRSLPLLLCLLLLALVQGQQQRMMERSSSSSSSSSSVASSFRGKAGPLKGMPLPFTRVLDLVSPPMHGEDVRIAQFLVNRVVPVWKQVNVTGVFDKETVIAIGHFQVSQNLDFTGQVDRRTGKALLALGTADNYKDDGKPARASNALYKILVPVYFNRSVETEGTLLDQDNNVLLKFRVRAHGHAHAGKTPWPEFNNEGQGLNIFTSNGATPTGLYSTDMNTPESDPNLYGPYPINRAVDGLQGNAKFIYGTYGSGTRSGILMHTGNWAAHGWKGPGTDMPNSAGCLHAYPEDIEAVWNKLTSLGVKVNDNTNGQGSKYPYATQGLLSVFQID